MLRYFNNLIEEFYEVLIIKPIDGDRLNVFEIVNYIVALGYEYVVIKNILFKSSLPNMDSLRSLARDDSTRQIIRILKNEGENQLRIDHEVNFADVINLMLSISWKDVAINKGDGVGVDNNNERLFKNDLGNVKAKRQGINDDNLDNSHKEFDS